MDEHPPALELSRLARHFGERPVLSEITLSLQPGRTLVVFGPNGAGKTTLLRVLAGLLRPHSGRVAVLGHELPREGHALRGQVGWLGHEPLLYRELTAHENLTFHARLHGVHSQHVDRSLAAVGMASRAHEPVRELSRGMVQRVAAARAVLAAPPLLLLDEPHANLDPAARELLEPLIGRSSGRTRVITSHDPVQGLAEADLVLGLRAGGAAMLSDAASVDAGQIMELYG
ncbi:MAG: heme ABC exporter ATP-binding protein CcmA [Solirubrobacteraceae bacterium]